MESFPVRKKIHLIHLSESYEMGTGELLFYRRSGRSGLLTEKRAIKSLHFNNDFGKATIYLGLLGPRAGNRCK